jgi:Uncharacterized conserved protein (DUF2045)
MIMPSDSSAIRICARAPNSSCPAAASAPAASSGTLRQHIQQTIMQNNLILAGSQVVTPVYASPMRVAVNLDSSRAADAAPAPAYPDICFAVDEFDEAHSHMVRGRSISGLGCSMQPKSWSSAQMKTSRHTECLVLQVLDDPEQCYAVVLSAVDGPALPPADCETSSAAAAAAAGGSTSSAAHRRSAGGGSDGGGGSSAAVAHAAGAGEQPQSAILQRSSQQRAQQLPGQLEAECAPAPTTGKGLQAGAGNAAGGAPAEGVTLWQYVSEGGASTTAVDSRAPDPLPGAPLMYHSWSACFHLSSAQLLQCTNSNPGGVVSGIAAHAGQGREKLIAAPPQRLQSRRRRWRPSSGHSPIRSSPPARGGACSRGPRRPGLALRQSAAAAAAAAAVQPSQRGTCRASPSLQAWPSICTLLSSTDCCSSCTVSSFAAASSQTASLTCIPAQQTRTADSRQGELPLISFVSCIQEHRIALLPAGFVSCEQLRSVVGSPHARAVAAWSGRSGTPAHRVVMRGPGEMLAAGAKLVPDCGCARRALDGWQVCEHHQGTWWTAGAVAGHSGASAMSSNSTQLDSPWFITSRCVRPAGGLGFADVAVAVVRQQEAAESADPDPGRLSLGVDSGSAGGEGRRGKLLARVAAGAFGVATQLAKGALEHLVQLQSNGAQRTRQDAVPLVCDAQTVLLASVSSTGHVITCVWPRAGVAREVLGGGDGERRPLRCGLMSLSTPIELLLREILAAWPQEDSGGR